MNCENLFCIYWEDGRCTLRYISLAISGSCTDCICVSLPEELLAQQRAELLARLDADLAMQEHGETGRVPPLTARP